MQLCWLIPNTMHFNARPLNAIDTSVPVIMSVNAYLSKHAVFFIILNVNFRRCSMCHSVPINAALLEVWFGC